MWSPQGLDGGPLYSGSRERDSFVASAPTSWSALSGYGVFLEHVNTTLTEGHLYGATKFYAAGDLNIQLGFDDTTGKDSLRGTHRRLKTDTCSRLCDFHFDLGGL